MNLFQWFALSALGLILLVEAIGWLRRPGMRRARTFRCLIWIAAAVAIYDPGLPQRAATAVGITRGADLVFYLAVLGFLGVSFYFYAGQVYLQRQVTELVRHIAIREARQGEEKES